MILWCYYLTQWLDDVMWSGHFSSKIDLAQAYDAKTVDLRALIKVRVNWEIIETTYWRLILMKLFLND